MASPSLSLLYEPLEWLMMTSTSMCCTCSLCIKYMLVIMQITCYRLGYEAKKSFSTNGNVDHSGFTEILYTV